MAEKPSYSSVIKNSGFRYLWFNQIFVQIAYYTLNFAMIIWVFRLTHTNLAVSALMLAIYLPSLFFGLFAGVFVDLTDKRKIILVVDLMLALAFFLLLLVKGSLIGILVVTFFINSFAQFFMPSESSSIPMLVSKSQLILANSLFSLTLYASLLIGFSISGPMIQIWGINSIFIFGSITLLMAFLLSQRLPVIKLNNKKKLGNPFSLLSLRYLIKLTFREGREMFGFIKNKLSIAVAIGLMSAVQGIVGMLAVMMPDYMERVLLIHATNASYFVMLPLGLGMISGAFLIGRLFHQLPRRSIVIPAVLLSGIVFILMGLAPTLVRLLQFSELSVRINHPRYFMMAPSLSTFSASLAFLLGVCMVSVVIPCQTVIQENTPPKNRGKIFAVLAILMTAFSALPIILAGGLSDLFGVRPIFITIGIIVAGIGLIAGHPGLFLQENRLSLRFKQFLGVGHWSE